MGTLTWDPCPNSSLLNAVTASGSACPSKTPTAMHTKTQSESSRSNRARRLEVDGVSERRSIDCGVAGALSGIVVAEVKLPSSSLCIGKEIPLSSSGSAMPIRIPVAKRRSERRPSVPHRMPIREDTAPSLRRSGSVTPSCFLRVPKCAGFVPARHVEDTRSTQFRPALTAIRGEKLKKRMHPFYTGRVC